MRLRFSACFTARGRTWPAHSATAPALLYLRHPCRRHAQRACFSVSSHHIVVLSVPPLRGLNRPTKSRCCRTAQGPKGWSRHPDLDVLCAHLCALGVLCGIPAFCSSRVPTESSECSELSDGEERNESGGAQTPQQNGKDG